MRVDRERNEIRLGVRKRSRETGGRKELKKGGRRTLPRGYSTRKRKTGTGNKHQRKSEKGCLEAKSDKGRKEGDRTERRKREKVGGGGEEEEEKGSWRGC